MKKLKAITAFLTAMTMTVGAIGVTAYAEEKTDKYSYPIDVNEKFEGIRGDMNGDGQITVRDASEIVKIISTGDTERITAKADYNEDGYVNIRDAAAIAREIAVEAEKAKKEKEQTEKELSELEANLMKELSELDPDTPIEDIISQYIEENALVYTEPTGIAGDVNYDGAVTVKDAALLAKYLANYIHMTQEEFDALTVQGDYNGDGIVNVRDIVDIAHYLANWKNNNKKEDTQPKEIISGDMNGDGEVTLRDGYIMAYVLADAAKNDYDISEWLTKGDYNGDGQFNVRDSARVIDDVIASGVLGENYKKRSDIVIVKGDADLDGEVSLADITLIVKFSLSRASFPLVNEVAYINADVNSDDTVDSIDITILLKDQLGKEKASE